MPPSSTDPLAHVRESYVPVRGAQLYVREVGSGAPLVVLHGGPDFNHSYLLPELDLLARAFRLIYFDQRGRGKSSPGVLAEDVTLESEIADVDALRQHFGLDKVAVLGHSWGGLLALEYATRHSDQLSFLVLLNTAPASHADLMRFRRQREAAEADSLAQMRALAATPAYAAGDIATEAEYCRAHFSAAVGRPEHLENIVRRLRVHFAPADIVKARAIEARLYAQTWQAPGYDLLPKLRHCNVPAVVIHGERDFIPPECARNAAAALSAARFVLLRDCGHFAYLERPAEVRDAIVAAAPRV